MSEFQKGLDFALALLLTTSLLVFSRKKYTSLAAHPS
jgi:hypothetical protein